jgi:Fe-Mn family superoxide dismutase
MNKREFVKLSFLAGLTGFLLKPMDSLAKKIFRRDNTKLFTLPALPYSFDALEPHIDKMTMEIHYKKHHQTYVDKLNEAVKNDVSIQDLSLEKIFKKISQLPAAVRNNGGGHYNHSLFWEILSPTSTKKPIGKLAEAINKKFESFDTFKQEFSKAAIGRFGSGWAWLSINESNELQISSTPNQDNPMMDVAEVKGIPILGLDVWEHAYYLKYQNKRPDYITAFWNIVNWEKVEKNYLLAIKS